MSGPEGVQGGRADRPEKLFSLFAQALFSAPPGGAGSSKVPLPGEAGQEVPQTVVPKLKAMLVGFKESELSFLCSVLGSLDFDTVKAADASRALEMISAGSIALLVVDWDSPATHALVLAQTLRKMPIEQPLIIGLATQLAKSLQLSARGTGFDQLYEKPLSQDLLVDCLQQRGFAVTEPSPGNAPRDTAEGDNFAS